MIHASKLATVAHIQMHSWSYPDVAVRERGSRPITSPTRSSWCIGTATRPDWRGSQHTYVCNESGRRPSRSVAGVLRSETGNRSTGGDKYVTSRFGGYYRWTGRPTSTMCGERSKMATKRSTTGDHGSRRCCQVPSILGSSTHQMDHGSND